MNFFQFDVNFVSKIFLLFENCFVYSLGDLAKGFYAASKLILQSVIW